MVLFLIVLHVGKKGYDIAAFFDTGGAGLTDEKKWVFFGMTFYFMIKLFFSPFHGQNSKDGNSLNMVNNFFVGNIVFILFVYSFKQYVIDICPVEFRSHVPIAASVFSIGSCVFCIFSLTAKKLLNKQFLIKRSLACLMLGAFLSFDKEVHMGIFTLLISHVFGMAALYAFFDGKKD